MRKINKLSNAIRVADATELCGKVGHEIQGAAIEDTHLSGIGTQIKSTHQSMVTALDQIHVYSTLKEKDEERDNDFRAIVTLTKGYTHHPDPKIKAAALQVLNVLESVGNHLTSTNYEAESGKLDSLLEKLAQPEMAESIAVLPGIQDLIDRLKLSQNDFREAEIKWNKTQQENKESENATSLKNKFVKIINDELVIYLMALSQSKPDTYQQLASNVALVIDKANTLIKHRRNGEVVEDEVIPENN